MILLVEAFPRDAVGKSAQGDRSVGDVGEDVWGDLEVVADEIALRVALFRPEDFV